jgi:quercetin dioxygenase-like cupin family protein
MAKAARKAAPRRAAKPKSTKRRASPRPKAKAQPQRRKAQSFNVSHHREEDFDSGLRSYASYRDLGTSKATGGMAQAHVIRFKPPCIPEVVSKRHYHDVKFQMVYVLRGWLRTELEGQGAITMRAGSAWIQPPRIRHSVLDYSDDCEVLEIVLPADFKTVELE